MFKILCISILLIPALLAAQPNGTEEHALEILNNWNRLESKFIEKANERLLYFLNEDPILKENFISGDSSNFKKLKLIIRPILKFKKEAENYTFKQDIFSLIDFDTIDIHSVAQFYLGDSLQFVLTRGHNECDIGYFKFGGKTPGWCPGDYFFKQFFYKTDRDLDCQWACFDYNNDTIFTFYIDFLWESFKIYDNKIWIFLGNNKNELIINSDKPNEIIKGKYKEEWIRHCARECPAGGKK